MKLGLVCGTWLPGAASQMSYLLATGTSREAQETARQLGRLPFSRSSFERVGHEVGKLYVTKHAGIDQELIEAFELPEGAAGLSVSLDRVSVPVEEPSKSSKASRTRRRKKRSTAKKRPKRRKTRRSRSAARPPIERNFRMAYCGTVAILDEDGEALHTIRYGRMPQGDPIDLAEGLASDVRALRARAQRELPVTLVQDGAPELWNLLDTQLNEDTLGTAPYRLIDLYHLLEKLSEAAKAIHGEHNSKPTLRQWKIRLENAKTAASMILAEFRNSGNDSSAVYDAMRPGCRWTAAPPAAWRVQNR